MSGITTEEMRARAEDVFAELSGYLSETNLLRNLAASHYAGDLAHVYNVVNTIHPFREGNGRTQREFVTALAREAGYDVNWTRVNGWVNDRASEAARAGDMRPMETMFARIVTLAADRPPAIVRLPGAVNAAYPSGAQKATDRSAGANAADYRRGYQTPGRGPAMDREG